MVVDVWIRGFLLLAGGVSFGWASDGGSVASSVGCSILAGGIVWNVNGLSGLFCPVENACWERLCRRVHLKEL